MLTSYQYANSSLFLYLLCLQISVLAQDWVDEAANSVPTSTGESSNSDHANKVGRESPSLAGEGNYGHVTIYDWDSPDEDMEQRKRGPTSSSSLQDNPYELDNDDRQLALALSEDYPQVDKEVARRLTKLESIKVCCFTKLRMILMWKPSSSYGDLQLSKVWWCTMSLNYGR